MNTPINIKLFWEVLNMGKMDYLKEKPIAVLGGGAVGKTCAADMKLAGRGKYNLFDMVPFAEKTLAHLEQNEVLTAVVRGTLLGFSTQGTPNSIWLQATWLRL